MIFFPVILKILIALLTQVPEIIFEHKSLKNRSETHTHLKILHLGNRLVCSYRKISSPVTEIPVGKTEISVSGPARLLI